jgi:hypothetical protein
MSLSQRLSPERAHEHYSKNTIQPHHPGRDFPFSSMGMLSNKERDFCVFCLIHYYVGPGACRFFFDVIMALA